MKRGSGNCIDAASREPLLSVDQSDFTKLMSLSTFQGEQRTVLAGFKDRWNGSEWMRTQKGYLERACLAAASQRQTGLSFCRCGLAYRDRNKKHRFQTCQMPAICPSCNFHRRVKPCEWEYLPAFDRAPFWHAFTVSWQSDPLIAGVHLVTHQDDLGRPLKTKHGRPWADRPDAPHSQRYSLDSMDMMLSMAETPFEFINHLVPRWLNGFYAAFEWDFTFWPRRNPAPCELSICHVALPHLHGFGNSSRDLTFDDCQAIYRVYGEACIAMLKSADLPSYPDLHIAPIKTCKNLKRWMGYNIKSIAFEKFYLEGVGNGCALDALNMDFEQTFWDAIALVRTPRKFGNLHPLNTGYIGLQQFRKMTKPQVDSLRRKLDIGNLTDQDIRRWEKHLKACEQQQAHNKETRERRRRMIINDL